jgi:hypothetical protein
MGRACIAVGFLQVGLVLASCGGGGGSSPTAPTPTPGSLAGTWRGEISGTAGGDAFTCALELDLAQAEGEEDDEFFAGGWSAECPGAEVAGLAVVIDVGGFTLLSAFSPVTAPALHPLGTCGWSAQVVLRGNELSGTWIPPNNCEDPSLTGGPVRVRFAG